MWVGDIVPGVRAVLGTVWGEAAPDTLHDARLNAGLGVAPDHALAFYRLLLFNTSSEDRDVALRDGALVVRPAGAGEPARLLDLSDLLGRGEATVSPALRVVLEGEGTLRPRVSLPAGRMADLIVPFDRRVGLEDAQDVETGDGTAFARRQMNRVDLEALMVSPDQASIQKL